MKLFRAFLIFSLLLIVFSCSSHDLSNTKCTISASSRLNQTDIVSPEGILTGKSIWHSQTPPNFPEWVQFKYDDAVQIKSIGIQAQEDSPNGTEHTRAPKSFIFQGSNDGKEWSSLLRVKDATFINGGEWKSWDLSTSSSFVYYRLFVESGGDPTVLTIMQIQFK